MTQTALRTLEKRVRELIGPRSFHGLVQDVRVELSDWDDGIVRVVITLDRPGSVAIPDLLDLTRTIEDELSELDERFPSVSFAEAA